MPFPRLAPLGAMVLLLAASPGPLRAQQGSSPRANDHADAAIAVRFGTLGVGLEAGKLLTAHLAVRVGANYLDLNATKTQSDITYNASFRLKAVSALLDFYPGTRGSFHLTGGLMTNPATVSATGRPTASGTFTIDGITYTAAQVGTLDGELTFPDVGPYVGLGWGTPARSGGGALRFLFDLGAVIGTPTVSLSASGAAANPALASDLQAQQDRTQRDVDKYAKVYPVVSFGLAYRF